MCSDEEANEGNGDDGVEHASRVGNGESCETNDGGGDDTEARKDDDVDFRVTEVSEEVLENDWIASNKRREDNCIGATIEEEKCDAGTEDGENDDEHEGDDDDGSGVEVEIAHELTAATDDEDGSEES
jgi:hypothetical protein